MDPGADILQEFLDVPTWQIQHRGPWNDFSEGRQPDVAIFERCMAQLSSDAPEIEAWFWRPSF